MAGALLWGLQLAVTQGLLVASVTDATPVAQRGTAFGIYDLAIGAASFFASTAAGALWNLGGQAWKCGFSALIGTVAIRSASHAAGTRRAKTQIFARQKESR